MVRAVDEMPWEGEFTVQATAALLRYGHDTLAYTHRFYEVRDPAGAIILGAGVALWNFARPPELWIMLAKPYFLNLRRSLRITREALALPASEFAGLVCDVSIDSATEMHFVMHIGWTPTGQMSHRPNAERFIQFGVK